MIFYFGIVFCLSGFIFTIVSFSIPNILIHIYVSLFFIRYAFQFFTNKKMDDVVTKVYYSILILIVLLMNTFLYCGAGELVMEQVSYTIYMYIQRFINNAISYIQQFTNTA